MQKEIRTIFYDSDLMVELYHFKGLRQKFPDHFHDYYVIGLIQSGKRAMQCNNKTYTITPDNIVVFNPGQAHSCVQIADYCLDYFSLNIPTTVMQKNFFDITGKHANITFTKNVICDSDLYGTMVQLYQLLLSEHDALEKEELYCWFLGQLFLECAIFDEEEPSDFRFEKTIEYMQKNYSNTITLDTLASISSLSKYYFLRLFTKKFGISPYSYLQTIRINRAKELIKTNTLLNEIPYMTGFSDQSHFTSFFKRFSGVTPAQYRKIFYDKTTKD